MQAEHISTVLGEPPNEPSNIISKDTCLANLLTAKPGIMIDQDAMERLQSLASQLRRIGKALPEECSSSALCAIAYKCPGVFGMEVLEVASVIMCDVLATGLVFNILDLSQIV